MLHVRKSNKIRKENHGHSKDAFTSPYILKENLYDNNNNTFLTVPPGHTSHNRGLWQTDRTDSLSDPHILPLDVSLPEMQKERRNKAKLVR